MTKADKQAEEIAALRREVEALKAAQPKPKPEFKPEPYQCYDPTAGMSMPRSALEAMIAAEPRGFMAGVVGDNRAPTSPGMIPREQPTGPAGGAPSPTPGYSEPRPLSPPPGIRWVDAQLDAQDAKDRAELARKLGALGKR